MYSRVTGADHVAMVHVRVQESASYRLDEIYRYTRHHCGTEQAERYITGLFEAFNGIATHITPSRPMPPGSALRVTFSATNGTSSTGVGSRMATLVL
ncbi:plasmid stabilization system protein ParE [Paraburkholderia sp. EB58]|jgi:plasmid stabilization system protein ParE